MENDLKKAYEELEKSFMQLPTDEKRIAVANKIKEMSEVFNKINSSDDIVNTNNTYVSEDEYLCYLNGLIYNLEHKIGNVFKSII